MLGFTPVESVVLVLVRGGVLDCLMRADLAEAMRADGPERLADLVARNSADGVVAVVVSAEGASCPMCGSQFRALVGDVSAALKRRGGQLFDAVMVERVEAGGRWSCIDNCGVAGVSMTRPRGDGCGGGRGRRRMLARVTNSRRASLSTPTGWPRGAD